MIDSSRGGTCKSFTDFAARKAAAIFAFSKGVDFSYRTRVLSRMSRMKTHPTLKVIAVACVGALASCATKPETQRVPVSGAIRPDTSLTGKVLQEVNSYRRARGVADLQRHGGLDRLAQEHCEFLRQHRGTFTLSGHNVSHIGFEGRTLAARELYRMENIGENVAATPSGGSNPAPALVTLWQNSKSHEYNMRSPWTYTGIGMVVDKDGMVFCTQLFSTANHSQLATRQRFSGF